MAYDYGYGNLGNEIIKLFSRGEPDFLWARSSGNNYYKHETPWNSKGFHAFESALTNF